MDNEENGNLLYENLTYQIRGACFDVWKKFRGGFKESIVDKALSIEFKSRNLKVEDQKRIDIYYNNEKVGTYIPDKIVEDKVLIEIKSKPYITKEDERQFWKYLQASKYKIGMLINFGSEGLEIMRRIYDKARENRMFRVDQRLNPRRSASMKKGFTLIELIVVIAIVSVLSGIILFSISQYISRGKDSSVSGNLAILIPAGEVFYGGNSNSYGSFCDPNINSVIKNVFNQIPQNPNGDCFSSGSNPGVCCNVSSDNNSWAACAKEFTDTSKAYCVDSRGMKEDIANTACIAAITQCP